MPGDRCQRGDYSCYEAQSPDQIVSNGKALEAMILNGLGFVNKRLYLIPQFLEDKPVEVLQGEGVEAGHSFLRQLCQHN